MLFDFFASSTGFLNTVSDAAFLVIGFVGIIGIVGAVSAYFYKGRADALIKLQSEEINVLKDTNKRLVDQNKELISQREEFLLEQKRMRSEIKTLRGLIQQPKQFKVLATTLANQHTEVIDKLTNLANGLISSREEN